MRSWSRTASGVLQPGTLLLALLAIASVAVLVGRRLSEYARRVGLLKAVGSLAERGCGDLPCREPPTGAFGRHCRPLGRLAGLTTAHETRCGSHRRAGRAGALAEHGGRGRRAGARRRPRGDARSRPPRVVQQHCRCAEQRRPPAAAPGRTHSDLKPVADPCAVRAPTSRARRPRRALLSAANVAVTVTGIVTVIAFHAFANDKLSKPQRSRRADCPTRSSTGTSRCSRSSRSCSSPSRS